MKQNIHYFRFIAVSVFILITNIDIVKSQYFGRNKPGYEVFDFSVYETPNFEIYHYFNDSNTVKQLATTSEQWYKMHHEVFLDSIKSKNPLIFYQDHADFQQTNASFSSIGIGTGGFTEALKNRVVMPVSLTKSQTDHVLGHELVHAFQYNIFTKDSALSLKNMQNIPLWMVEGMAEYLSIGSVSPQTSMWMRDAILNDQFPTLEEMTSNTGKYNPYRYGHAFWAFATKMWGDTIVKPIFILTAKHGYSAALDSVVGFDGKTVSNMWKMSTLSYYKNLMGDTIDHVVGKKLLFEDNAGEMNISPVISPDGKYVAFLSEKDLFSIDLFLADAKTGEIKTKLSSTVHNSEIDAFNFIESAGTWSPDGKQFAHIIFSKGRNKLAVVNVQKSKITDEIDMGKIQSFNNPSWSPDGKNIAFAGMIDGQGNLFIYNLESGKISNLTNDSFSNIQPSWSADGKKIVFVTDRKQHSQTNNNLKANIAILTIETGEINVLDVFPGADNYNPLFTNDGNSIIFLSDRDGYRNLYRYDLVSGKVYQQTNYLTGISGITLQSPAISIANNNDVTYSYYFNQKYTVYKANLKDFNEVEVDRYNLEYSASTLPPMKHFSENIVDNHLYNSRPEINPDIIHKFKEVPYRPKFKLDYISNSGFGFGTSRFGTSMAGSVSAIFSDIIGNNQLFASLALNGEIYDFGGQVAYFNQKQRINWGGAISHIPYRYGYYTLSQDTIDIDNESYIVDNYALDVIRLFETKATAFAFYPISTTRRIEAGIGYGIYNYRIDRYNNYYDALGYGIGGDREKLPAPDGFNLFQTDVAYVFDNSYFAVTSPMEGRRSRISVEKNYGYYNHVSTLVDYRKYFFVNPVSFAFRFYNYSRWGNDAEKDRMNPLYVGYPWLVRGYDNISYQGQDVLDTTGLSINNLMGSKMQVVNFEFRIPFTGPKKLSLIPSKYFFTDLAFFVDGGLAWTNDDKPKLRWETKSYTERVPVFTAGASMRINLFGYMIIEPYYAFPFQGNHQKKGVFGVNFTPGW